MARWVDYLGLAVCLVLGALFLFDHLTTPKKFGPAKQYTAAERRKLKKFGFFPAKEAKEAED